MRRFLISLLLTGLAFAIISPYYSQAAGTPAKVTIKFGQTVFQANKQPLIVKGRTLVPLRDIYEAMGQQVTWNAKTKTVTAKRGNQASTITIGSRQAKVGKQNTTLDAAPLIYQQSTYVPLRFVATAVGAKVAWDNQTRTVTITDPVVSGWLARMTTYGKSLFWKLTDINKDGQLELLALIQKTSGRQFAVLGPRNLIFSTVVSSQLNEIALVDLNQKTKAVAIYKSSGGKLSQVLLYSFTPKVTKLGEFAGTKGSVTFISTGGKTKILVVTGKYKSLWEYNGTKMVKVALPANLPALIGSGGTSSGGSGSAGGSGSTGGSGSKTGSGSSSTPAGSGNTTSPSGSQPNQASSTDFRKVSSVSKTLFSRILAGNIEGIKEMAANSQVAEQLVKCEADTKAFIAKHNGAAWKPATGAVINGSSAQFYNWIKYPNDSGYVVVKLKNSNGTWLITGAEFKAVQKRV